MQSYSVGPDEFLFVTPLEWQLECARDSSCSSFRHVRSAVAQHLLEEIARRRQDLLQHLYMELVGPIPRYAQFNEDLLAALLQGIGEDTAVPDEAPYMAAFYVLHSQRPLPTYIVPQVPRAPSKLKEAPPGHIMWIGFELVDQDGSPLPAEAFVLTHPDQTESTGRLNAEGRVRADPTLDGTFGFVVTQQKRPPSESSEYVDIELVDDAGAAMGGAQYQLLGGGLTLREGILDESGRAHLAGLPAGPFELILMGFEPETVSLQGKTASPASRGTRVARTHTVAPGESLAQIAHAAGIENGKKLYDAPENAALRKRRPDPNRIRPGDEISIPASPAASFTLRGGEVARIKAPKLPGTLLHMRMLGPDAEPLRDASYELSGTGFSYLGKLDGAGMLKHELPASAGEARLLVATATWTLEQTLTLLDEEHGTMGQQVRLANLGFCDGLIGSESSSSALLAGVDYYRRHKGLRASGEPDERINNELEQDYTA